MKDIRDLNPIKKKVEFLLNSFNLFYRGKSKRSVHESLVHSDNPVVKTIMDIIDETVPHIKDHEFYQGRRIKSDKIKSRYRDLIRGPLEFFLSVYTLDSAYRDIGDYMLKRFKDKLINDKSLQAYIDSQVKHPDHFYCNVWEDFQKRTMEKQQSGELEVGELDEFEHTFVDETQRAQTEHRIKEEQKILKKHSHW